MYFSQAQRVSVASGSSGSQPMRRSRVVGGAQARVSPVVLHGSLRDYVAQLQARTRVEFATLLKQQGIINVREPLEDYEQVPQNNAQLMRNVAHADDARRCGTVVVHRLHVRDDSTPEWSSHVAHVAIGDEVQRARITVDMRWDPSQSLAREKSMWREMMRQVQHLLQCYDACKSSGTFEGGATLKLALQWRLAASVVSAVGGGNSRVASIDARSSPSDSNEQHFANYKSASEVLFERQAAEQRRRKSLTDTFADQMRRSYPSMSVMHARGLERAQETRGSDAGVRVILDCAVKHIGEIQYGRHRHVVDAMVVDGPYEADKQIDSLTDFLSKLAQALPKPPEGVQNNQAFRKWLGSDDETSLEWLWDGQTLGSNPSAMQLRNRATRMRTLFEVVTKHREELDESRRDLETTHGKAADALEHTGETLRSLEQSARTIEARIPELEDELKETDRFLGRLAADIQQTTTTIQDVIRAQDNYTQEFSEKQKVVSGLEQKIKSLEQDHEQRLEGVTTAQEEYEKLHQTLIEMQHPNANVSPADLAKAKASKEEAEATLNALVKERYAIMERRNEINDDVDIRKQELELLSTALEEIEEKINSSTERLTGLQQDKAQQNEAREEQVAKIAERRSTLKQTKKDITAAEKEFEQIKVAIDSLNSARRSVAESIRRTDGKIQQLNAEMRLLVNEAERVEQVEEQERQRKLAEEEQRRKNLLAAQKQAEQDKQLKSGQQQTFQSSSQQTSSSTLPSGAGTKPLSPKPPVPSVPLTLAEQVAELSKTIEEKAKANQELKNKIELGKAEEQKRLVEFIKTKNDLVAAQSSKNVLDDERTTAETEKNEAEKLKNEAEGWRAAADTTFQKIKKKYDVAHQQFQNADEAWKTASKKTTQLFEEGDNLAKRKQEALSNNNLEQVEEIQQLITRNSENYTRASKEQLEIEQKRTEKLQEALQLLDAKNKAYTLLETHGRKRDDAQSKYDMALAKFFTIDQQFDEKVTQINTITSRREKAELLYTQQAQSNSQLAESLKNGEIEYDNLVSQYNLLNSQLADEQQAAALSSVVDVPEDDSDANKSANDTSPPSPSSSQQKESIDSTSSSSSSVVDVPEDDSDGNKSASDTSPPSPSSSQQRESIDSTSSSSPSSPPGDANDSIADDSDTQEVDQEEQEVVASDTADDDSDFLLAPSSQRSSLGDADDAEDDNILSQLPSNPPRQARTSGAADALLDINNWSEQFVDVHRRQDNNLSYVAQMRIDPPAIISASVAAQELYPAELREQLRDALKKVPANRSESLLASVYDRVHPTVAVVMQLASYANELSEFAALLPENLNRLHEKTSDFITRDVKTGGLGYTKKAMHKCPVTYNVVFAEFLASYVASPVLTLFYKHLDSDSNEFDKLTEDQLKQFKSFTDKIKDDERLRKHMRELLLQFAQITGQEAITLTKTLTKKTEESQQALRNEMQQNTDTPSKMPDNYAISDWDVLRNLIIAEDNLRKSSQFAKKVSGVSVQQSLPTLTEKPMIQLNWQKLQQRYNKKIETGAITDATMLSTVTEAVRRLAHNEMIGQLKDKEMIRWFNFISHLKRTVSVVKDEKSESIVAGHRNLLKTDLPEIIPGIANYIQKNNTAEYRLCYVQSILRVMHRMLQPARLLDLVNDHFGADKVREIIGDRATSAPTKESLLLRIDGPKQFLQLQTLLLARIYILQIVRAQYVMYQVLGAFEKALAHQLNTDAFNLSAVFGDNFDQALTSVKDRAELAFYEALKESFKLSNAPKKALETTLAWTQGLLCHMEINVDNDQLSVAKTNLSLSEDLQNILAEITRVEQLTPRLELGNLDKQIAPQSPSLPTTSSLSSTAAVRSPYRSPGKKPKTLLEDLQEQE